LTGDIDRLAEEALASAGSRPSPPGRAAATATPQEFSLELLERDESTVRDVLDALERVRVGAFGFCESCGAAVHKERLRLMPHAKNCIACQRKRKGPGER